VKREMRNMDTDKEKKRERNKDKKKIQAKTHRASEKQVN
jgi:hypothetical protein